MVISCPFPAGIQAYCPYHREIAEHVPACCVLCESRLEGKGDISRSGRTKPVLGPWQVMPMTSAEGRFGGGRMKPEANGQSEIRAGFFRFFFPPAEQPCTWQGAALYSCGCDTVATVSARSGRPYLQNILWGKR